MLLRRSPQTFWACAAIAEQLGARPELVAAKLEVLQKRGILTVGEQTGAYRYAPADEPLKKLMDDLATAYAERRVAVINTIYSMNLERLQAFSNAFRVK